MDKFKVDKLLILIKITISLFITYLILFKGDAGIIIHNIGSFIASGNSLIGFIMLISIQALSPAIIYSFTNQNNDLYKISKVLFCFDTVLVFINLCCGFLYSVMFLQMPISDAFSKFIILATGSVIIYILLTVCTLLLIKYFVNKNLEQPPNNLVFNNNPLFFYGRMKRVPYLITKVFFYIFLIGVFFIKQNFSKSIFDIYDVTYLISQQIIFILSFYAASKRLRDIKWSQCFLILWSIPFIGIGVGLPLLFVKSK